MRKGVAAGSAHAGGDALCMSFSESVGGPAGGFALGLLPGGVAKADMGPKPSITLKVVNGPADYYVALLAHSSATGRPDNGEEIVGETVWNIITSYQVDGWQVFWSPVGTNVKQANEKSSYYFSYMVPDPFRVLLVTSDGETYVSDELDQVGFNARCTYDVATGALTEQLSNLERDKAEKGYDIVVGYDYILLCLGVTLVLEFLVLFLFRIPRSKRNLLCFFAANVITNLSYSYYSVRTSKQPDFFLRCVIFEVFIAVFEGAFYAIFMRDADGKRDGQQHITYGVAANLLSALTGLGLLAAYSMLGWFGGSLW